MTQATIDHPLQRDIQANPETINLAEPGSFYRYEINQFDLIDSKQVINLAQEIDHARKTPQRTHKRLEMMIQETQEAKEAKQKLIESNLRLVLYVARKYKGLSIDLMDLIQEGNLGLMHAVEKFDYRKGYQFSTYAMWWIRQYITRALSEQMGIIYVPYYKVAAKKRMQKHLQQQKDAHEPTIEDLARQMDMSVEQIAELLSTGQETLSLDRKRTIGDDEVAMADLIEDLAQTPEQVTLTHTLQEQLQELLKTLPFQERRVLELRYGLQGSYPCDGLASLFAEGDELDDGREHSYLEIGKELGLSHEAIRQIEFRALRKLEALCHDCRLQDFLFE
ncbi:MAG: sigma-70 family RNA polymerase sigma factor [Ktedonobacteraceae bacterium]|nr:sigma-70 family RNA polymerase sigma factor [Ktedonobacteraceae bacterium]